MIFNTVQNLLSFKEMRFFLCRKLHLLIGNLKNKTIKKLFIVYFLLVKKSMLTNSGIPNAFNNLFFQLKESMDSFALSLSHDYHW